MDAAQLGRVRQFAADQHVRGPEVRCSAGPEHRVHFVQPLLPVSDLSDESACAIGTGIQARFSEDGV